MWNISAFARLALGALLVTGSASVARADIRLTESSLSTSVRARVDPHTVDQTDAEADVPDPGTFRDMSADAAASDSEVVSESVAVAGSVTFTAADTFTVRLVATRSGSDTGVDEPGGLYFAHADFEFSFLALADGVVTVGSRFAFSRPQTGTFTPLGLALESGNIRDARDPRVAFDDTSGTGGSVDQLPVVANRGVHAPDRRADVRCDVQSDRGGVVGCHLRRTDASGRERHVAEQHDQQHQQQHDQHHHHHHGHHDDDAATYVRGPLPGCLYVTVSAAVDRDEPEARLLPPRARGIRQPGTGHAIAQARGEKAVGDVRRRVESAGEGQDIRGLCEWGARHARGVLQPLMA